MRLTVLLLFLLLSMSMKAQPDSQKTRKPSVSDAVHVGIGVGLDHGGYGGRVDVPVSRHLAGLVGVGHAIVGPGWNLGIQYRFAPESRTGVYATALYGYNGVIKVQDAGRYDDIYYGFSAGFGLEFRAARSANFFRLAMLVPFRSTEFWGDWDELKDDKGAEVKQAPLPVAFSIGYHFAL